MACRSGKIDIVALLLERGANVNGRANVRIQQLTTSTTSFITLCSGW